MIGREQETKRLRDRARYYNILVLVSFLVIGARLYVLQIMQGDELKKFSDRNRLKKEKLLPTRGLLFDRDGRVIVENQASFDVMMLSQYYPFKNDLNLKLSQVLDIPLEDFSKKLKKIRKSRSFHPSLLRSDVGKDVIAGIEMDLRGFPGVYIDATVQRRYPFGEISSHVWGYASEVNDREIKKHPERNLQPGDYIGKGGLERRFDEHLRGENGARYVEVDARGRRRQAEIGARLLGFSRTDPVPGSNLRLTVDMDVSRAAFEAMSSRGYRGAVVAMDPRNGEVLAMVNVPSFDPTVLSGREISSEVWAGLSKDPFRPLRNRAIQDHYPPGSTFKLFVAIAALAEGVVDLKTKVKCNGFVRLGRRKVHCWKKHGVVDIFRSIKESCDVYYYHAGQLLGVDKIAEYARAFGFGKSSGIELPGEVRGLIPDAQWKLKTFKEPWQPGETLSVAIGQGFVLSSPLQLATAYSALANGGFVYRPHIVKRVEDRMGNLLWKAKPELIQKAEVPSEVFRTIREGLFRVVNSKGGTAYWQRSGIVGISGKTGTAQVRNFKDIKAHKCDDLPYKERHHGWFVGYAPRTSPQIVVSVIGEHVCHSSYAALVVRDVVEAYFKKHPLDQGGTLPRELAKEPKNPFPVLNSELKNGGGDGQ